MSPRPPGTVPAPAGDTKCIKNASSKSFHDSTVDGNLVWRKYLYEDKGYWWWCEEDSDGFIETSPGAWTQYLDPVSERQYWWRDDDNWFWINGSVGESGNRRKADAKSATGPQLEVPPFVTQEDELQDRVHQVDPAILARAEDLIFYASESSGVDRLNDWVQQLCELKEAGGSFAFPSDLDPADRKAVHFLCDSLGLAHCSKGEGSQRRLHVEAPQHR